MRAARGHGSVQWLLLLWLLVATAVVSLGAVAGSGTARFQLGACTLLIVALLGLLQMLRSRRSEAVASSNSIHDQLLRGIIVIPVLLLAFDRNGALRSAGSGKFLLVATVVGGAFLLSMKSGARRGASRAVYAWRDRALCVLVIYMLIGSIYGRWKMGIPSTLLSGAFPLLLSLPFCRFDIQTASSRSHLTRLILICLTVFSVMDFVGMLWPEALSAAPGAYGHEKSYLLLAAILGWWLRRNFAMVLFCLFVGCGVYLNYSAATYVLVTLGGVLTCLITSARLSGRLVGGLAGFGALAGAVSAFTEMQAVSGYTSLYFSIAGKQNNDTFRLAVYRAAKERISDSPWFGSLFTDYTTVQIPYGLTVSPTQTRAPSHSDMLEVWMLGGLVALALLLFWLVATNIAVVRFCRGENDAASITLARLFLLLINGFFIVGLVNPIMDQTGNALVLAAAVLGLRATLSPQISKMKEEELDQEDVGRASRTLSL